MMNEAGETGSEPALPASPRHFGQLPDSDISDDFDETSPEDDWPIDVEALREALREAEADLEELSIPVDRGVSGDLRFG